MDLPSTTLLPASADGAFDRYARMVRAAVGVPVALVSLVSRTGQVFPGAVGLPQPWQSQRRTPLSHSFCQYVVDTGRPLLVEDAREDPVLRHNLAIEELSVIGYAGIPLRDATGAVVGSLCAIDGQPHTWTPSEVAKLSDLAEACSAELQLRQSLDEVRRARRAADDGAERVGRVLESMPVGFLAVDAEWRITSVNGEAERITGAARTDLLGATLWERFPATVGTEFESSYRRAAETGQTVSFDAYYPHPLDLWAEVHAVPERVGLSLYFLDITARRRAQEGAERAAARLALLATVATELAGTLEADEAVTELPRLLVTALADWCIVSLLEEGHGPWRGRLRDVASWHADPSRRELAERFSTLRVQALSEASSTARLMRTGRPTVVAADPAATADGVLEPGEARDLFRQLAPGAAVVLPLADRGRLLGVLTAFTSAEHGAFAEGDLAALTDIATQVGLALGNSRLHAAQRDLAEQLQRSLLTAPVQPDHVQIVVRYQPAARAAQVGGDWYDAVTCPDGATVLVIGDVVGHDSAAAAAMGQVRGLLRAVAAHTGGGPAEVLSGTDQLMRTLQVDTTATAVVGRLEQTPDERERGVTRLRVSNAGHPPPMTILPDGSVSALVGLEADLLLGIFPDSERVESVVTLDRGATVLLYTDGLVEQRQQSLDVGLTRLRDTLTDLAALDLSLDDLCDQLLARLVPYRGEDDVALLAVRLHPQDAPRPAEAGPQHLPPDVPPER